MLHTFSTSDLKNIQQHPPQGLENLTPYQIAALQFLILAPTTLSIFKDLLIDPSKPILRLEDGDFSIDHSLFIGGNHLVFSGFVAGVLPSEINIFNQIRHLLSHISKLSIVTIDDFDGTNLSDMRRNILRSTNQFNHELKQLQVYEFSSLVIDIVLIFRQINKLDFGEEVNNMFAELLMMVLNNLKRFSSRYSPEMLFMLKISLEFLLKYFKNEFMSEVLTDFLSKFINSIDYDESEVARFKGIHNDHKDVIYYGYPDHLYGDIDSFITFVDKRTGYFLDSGLLDQFIKKLIAYNVNLKF